MLISPFQLMTRNRPAFAGFWPRYLPVRGRLFRLSVVLRNRRDEPYRTVSYEWVSPPREKTYAGRGLTVVDIAQEFLDESSQHIPRQGLASSLLTESRLMLSRLAICLLEAPFFKSSRTRFECNPAESGRARSRKGPTAERSHVESLAPVSRHRCCDCWPCLVSSKIPGSSGQKEPVKKTVTFRVEIAEIAGRETADQHEWLVTHGSSMYLSAPT